MMAEIKWITNNVTFERGNYLAVVAKFDNSKVWLGLGAMMTARNVKFWAESLAKEHNSATVELKYLKDCTDEKNNHVLPRLRPNRRRINRML